MHASLSALQTYSETNVRTQSHSLLSLLTIGASKSTNLHRKIAHQFVEQYHLSMLYIIHPTYFHKLPIQPLSSLHFLPKKHQPLCKQSHFRPNPTPKAPEYPGKHQAPTRFKAPSRKPTARSQLPVACCRARPLRDRSRDGGRGPRRRGGCGGCCGGHGRDDRGRRFLRDVSNRFKHSTKRS